MTVCVFAASSSRVDGTFEAAASQLGYLLAREGIDVIYGGGGIGLMGKLADSVLENGGKITGVIPSFMQDEGWGHTRVKDMIVTRDMGERKKKMFDLAEAVIALPGGIGTLEELTEALTLKQLGLYKGSIIVLNTLNFYNPLFHLIDQMIAGKFLRIEHKDIWKVAMTPEEVISSLNNYDGWIDNPRDIARI
jgi:uncharacterized protein (TIGR00730 family)